MPRDVGSACKKRQHPDGLHLSSSLPKRQLSVSEGEIGSSVEDASVSPGTAMNTPHGSFCNSTSSALINSDYSTSIHPAHSSTIMSMDVTSSKSEGLDFVLSRLPSDVASSKLERPDFVLSRLHFDAASSKLEGADRMQSLTPSNVASHDIRTSNSDRNVFYQGTSQGIWTYHSESTRHEGLDFDGEMSEVTFEKHARTLPFSQEPGGVSGYEKATHVISRRDVSSLNSKDELWHKTGHGHGDRAALGKQWESSSKLFAPRQKRDYRFSSAACESASSCATTGDSIRQKQAFAQPFRLAGKSFSTTLSHSHTRAEVLVETSLQERSSREDGTITQRSWSSEGASHPPFAQKVASEEVSPSYVLSSGRMSLEEEAKLGRRAPTIDHDFEEYFSSLML